MTDNALWLLACTYLADRALTWYFSLTRLADSDARKKAADDREAGSLAMLNRLSDEMKALREHVERRDTVAK